MEEVGTGEAGTVIHRATLPDLGNILVASTGLEQNEKNTYLMQRSLEKYGNIWATVMCYEEKSRKLLNLRN